MSHYNVISWKYNTCLYNTDGIKLYFFLCGRDIGPKTDKESVKFLMGDIYTYPPIPDPQWFSIQPNESLISPWEYFNNTTEIALVSKPAMVTDFIDSLV